MSMLIEINQNSYKIENKKGLKLLKIAPNSLKLG